MAFQQVLFLEVFLVYFGLNNPFEWLALKKLIKAFLFTWIEKHVFIMEIFIKYSPRHKTYCVAFQQVFSLSLLTFFLHGCSSKDIWT